MKPAARDRSKTRVRFQVAGQPFGVYTWSRDRKAGLVVRVGPLGHLQVDTYRCKLVGLRADGRRGKHGVKLSCWGVSGRRRKKAIELAVHL